MDEREILRIAVRHDIDSYLTEALTLEFVRDVLKAARRTTTDREAWISVDERLPEAHTFWLVCAETDEGLTVQSMYFDGKNWIHDGEPTFCHSYMLRPTHWMPLPAAPGQTPVASPRDTLIEEIAEMVDHMGEGRRLEEYVGAIREMKSGDKGGA
ncbi:DUF551 domain-containing protein [Burkholderia vietnamiensis]|uniref:DUF551 domain-containing protein n=1 Tax=Burkholderia vietnamiensis (strain G4 / LMG 22486) TaxID=269482 RepID=A4JD06_BURVG|nr:DUF551 domain-containing protein [Burkholderia vietnamiensis]ABO54159.1 hypothetical protein Bcep1808_1148 [Burkholderia vietnamiensis G4]MCB4347285.1 DUF551 domain-containing protein [Burkholderia vietnamiensis]